MPTRYERIFFTRKSECSSRWDPHFHSPRFAHLEKELDEIGAVPMREVSTHIFSGITPLSGGEAYTGAPDGIAFIRSGDFNEDGTINHDALIRLKPEIHQKVMRRSRLKQNDVLFAIVGATIGKVGIFQEDYEANINQAICAVRFDKAVIPEFAHAFFLTRLGKEQIERIKRPVARANINLEEIGTLRLPIFHRMKQREIVATLQEAIAKKLAAEGKAIELFKAIDHVVVTELGLSVTPKLVNRIQSRIFRSSFSALTGDRWDPNYHRLIGMFLERIRTSDFPIEKLGDSLAFVQYGISERATDEPVGIPMLRMINLQDGSWDISNLKYIEMDEKVKKAYLLQADDVLFNRTNSKELVGKCNVFDLTGEYVFASYLMRVRVNEQKVLPCYLVAYMASSLGRIQIDAVSRQIAGMTNINAEELRDLLIPVPPLVVQIRICQRVADIRRQALELKRQGSDALQMARQSIEALVLDKGDAR
jgi:restriction endonuclease S subunit